MKTLSGLVVLFSASLLSCSQPDKKQQETASADSAKTKTAVRVELADTAKTKLLADYLKLKTALVNSDSTAAGSAAAALEKGLKAVPGCNTASQVAGSIDQTATLAQQRAKFSLISNDLIPMMKSADVKSGHLYVQFCPMANDGKGGYWLSSEKMVKNPYYGQDMLECGEVKQEIN